MCLPAADRAANVSGPNVLYNDMVPDADGPETEGEEVAPGVTLVYNKEGRLIGIEILPASKIVAPPYFDSNP